MRPVYLILVLGAFLIESTQGNTLRALLSNDDSDDDSEEDIETTDSTFTTTTITSCTTGDCGSGYQCVTDSDSTLCTDSTASCSCQSGCVNKGTFYADGESFTVSNGVCTCSGGLVSCESTGFQSDALEGVV